MKKNTKAQIFKRPLLLVVAGFMLGVFSFWLTGSQLFKGQLSDIEIGTFTDEMDKISSIVTVKDDSMDNTYSVDHDAEYGADLHMDAIEAPAIDDAGPANETSWEVNWAAAFGVDKYDDGTGTMVPYGQFRSLNIHGVVFPYGYVDSMINETEYALNPADVGYELLVLYKTQETDADEIKIDYASSGAFDFEVSAEEFEAVYSVDIGLLDVTTGVVALPDTYNIDTDVPLVWVEDEEGRHDEEEARIIEYEAPAAVRIAPFCSGSYSEGTGEIYWTTTSSESDSIIYVDGAQSTLDDTDGEYQWRYNWTFSSDGADLDPQEGRYPITSPHSAGETITAELTIDSETDASLSAGVNTCEVVIEADVTVTPECYGTYVPAEGGQEARINWFYDTYTQEPAEPVLNDAWTYDWALPDATTSTEVNPTSYNPPAPGATEQTVYASLTITNQDDPTAYGTEDACEATIEAQPDEHTVYAECQGSFTPSADGEATGTITWTADGSKSMLNGVDDEVPPSADWTYAWEIAGAAESGSSPDTNHGQSVDGPYDVSADLTISRTISGELVSDLSEVCTVTVSAADSPDPTITAVISLISGTFNGPSIDYPIGSVELTFSNETTFDEYATLPYIFAWLFETPAGVEHDSESTAVQGDQIVEHAYPAGDGGVYEEEFYTAELNASDAESFDDDSNVVQYTINKPLMAGVECQATHNSRGDIEYYFQDSSETIDADYASAPEIDSYHVIIPSGGATTYEINKARSADPTATAPLEVSFIDPDTLSPDDNAALEAGGLEIDYIITNTNGTKDTIQKTCSYINADFELGDVVNTYYESGEQVGLLYYDTDFDSTSVASGDGIANYKWTYMINGSVTSKVTVEGPEDSINIDLLHTDSQAGYAKLDMTLIISSDFGINDSVTKSYNYDRTTEPFLEGGILEGMELFGAAAIDNRALDLGGAFELGVEGPDLRFEVQGISSPLTDAVARLSAYSFDIGEADLIDTDLSEVSLYQFDLSPADEESNDVISDEDMNILRAKGGASVYFEPYASCDLHEQVVHIKADLSQNFTFSRPEISYNGDAPQVLQAEAVILNGGLSRADASAVYYNAASANSYSATLYSADLDLLRSFEVDPGNDERDPDDYIAHLDINGSDDCPEYTDPTLTCEVEDGVNEGEYNATITIEENSELYNNYIWWFGDEEEGSEEEASGAAIAPENNEVMHTYYDPEEGTEFPVILNYQALDNMYAEVEPTVLHEGEAETVCTIPVSEDYIEAYDDNTTTEQGTPVIIDVLSNDDYNGTTPIPYTDVLTELVDEILPAGGTLEPVMDGDDVEAYEFTPDVDFTGDYVFDYKIIAKEDETLEDVATVTITVTPSPVEITLDCLEQADFEADIEYQVNLTLEDSYGAYNPIMQWNIEGVEEPTILTDYDPPIGGYFSHSFGAVGEYEVNAKAFMVPLDLNLDDEIALSEQYQLFDETVTCIFDEEEPEEYEEPDGEEVTIDNDCGIVNINNNSGDDQDNDQDGYVDCSVTTITTTITYNYYGDEPDDEEEPDEEEPDEEEPDEEEPDEEEPDEEEPETEDPDDPEESVEGDIFALGCLTEENYNAYTDVPLTYYYYDFIDEYSTLNAKADDSDLEPVVHGYPGQVFRPTWATTRAEAVKMLAHSMCAYDLYEALGGNIDDLPGITPFSDVPTSLWAHDKVAVFHELGIIQGYDVDENGDEVDGDITFRPHDYVTRGEFVKMLMQAFLLWNPNIDFDPDTYTVETEYETFADISGFEWVAPWAQFGNDMGIFLGYASGDAKPNQDIIRAEALTILHNAGVVLSESEDSLFNEYYGN